jgi:predicted amidohydrolase YtcJ
MRPAVAVLLVLTLMLAHPAAGAEKGDLVIWGGMVRTGIDGAPPAQAVVVRDGRVLYVGTRAGARRRIARDAEVINLRGATLFPGFTDAHAHLRGIGERELTLNLEGAASVAEVVERVRARLAAEPADRSPLIGRGWIETHWPERRFLTRQDLDAVTPDRPVLLVRADGHALVANSAALRAAGIDRTTQAPDGGEILKDAAGEPTGFLVDAAMSLVNVMRAREEPDRLARALAEGFRVYAARGWTGVHNMSVAWDEVQALEAAANDGNAPLRVYNSVTPEAAAALFESGPRSVADGRVVTRAVKIYADGALGSRGAALFEPYADAPGSTGLVQTSAEATAPLYDRALREGIQIATHAIGDRGNSLVLDWYAEAFARVPAAERRIVDPRWRVEHAQVVAPRDISRFVALGVIPSMQPSHAIGDLHFAPSRLGDARLDGAYAWKSFIEAGAIVPGGSDAPVERGDPLIEFYAATARKDLSGFSGADWRPHEAVDRATALKMFTLWPAIAAFREDELGVIAPGMRADFTAFSADLMTAPVEAIPRAKAVLTVVDGVVVHEALGR